MKNNSIYAYTKLDWLVMLAIFMFPVTFLTVRHGVHVSLFALLLIAAYYFWCVGLKNIQFDYPKDIFILFIFSGLFLSVLVSQIFRGAIHPAAFDGPFRILCAGIVFVLLKQRNISYIKILRIAIPFGLICLFVSLQLNPHSFWDERYATYFVDPNTLGAQAFIIGILSLSMAQPSCSQSIGLLSLNVVGGLLGIYISVKSGSRGGWLAAPFILSMVFIVKLQDMNSVSNAVRLKIFSQLIAIIFLALTVIFLAFYYSSNFSGRLLVGYSDIRNWFTGVDLNGSAGTRLSMWKFSFQFVQESLIFGYGEEKNMMEILQNSPLNIPINQAAINTMAAAGPHSDVLSKLLSAGIFGLLAYLCLLFVPFIIFWRHRNALDLDTKTASRVGLYYITGVFIAGLSNEQLSLKYLCTFYGLMIATLLAQVLHKPSTAEQSPISRVA